MNKKIFHIILFFSQQYVNANQSITTTMRPTTGNAFITMENSNGSATPSSITIGNKIYFGDGTNPIVINPNSNSNYEIIWPTGNNINLLGINSEGQLVTTVVNQLGSPSNNQITCYPNTGINIETINNQNINISANGSGNINFISDQINNPQVGNSYVTAINTNGNFITTNQSLLHIIGNNINGNYLSIDNANQNGIELNTSNLGGNINLNAGNYSISIFSNNIITPIASSLLGIDSNNNIITLSDNQTIICGDFTATGNVTLGNYSLINNTGNSINIPNSGNILLESGTGNNIQLNAIGNNSKIQLFGTGISAPSLGNPDIILALDSSNNLSTSNGNNAYLFGNNSGAGKSYIEINNITNTGISINGETTLKNGGYILPATGNTAALTINSNGQIGITVCSKRFKKNINPLLISQESFEKLQPCNYNYTNQSKKEIGLIAEEVYNIEEFKDLVIIGEDGLPLSVNYNALSVVNTAQIIEDRKTNKANIEEILQLLKESNNNLESQIKELREIIKSLQKN